MEAIDFKGTNIVYAKDQPEYRSLPAMRLEDGNVITCWKLTEDEIETLVKNKCFYVSVLTFNNPLQPMLPAAELSDLITLS